MNRQLDDRWARIWTADGELIDHIESVRIRRDSTSYTNSSTGRNLSLPTEDVETVAIRGDSGGAIGFVLGAVPGTLLVFSGGSGGNGIGAFLGVVLGIPAAILGGALGSLLFDALIADEWHLIYEGPAYNYF